MGMVPFLLIAAAEKRRRDAAAASARRKRAEEDKKKKSQSSSYSYSSSRGSCMERPYIDSLLKEIAYDNPELLEFFEKLFGAMNIAIEESCAESTKGITDCLDLAEKYVKQQQLLKERMKQAGLPVDELRFDGGVSFYAREANGRHLGYVPTDISFAGATITKAMAENPQDRTFEDAHERMQEEVESVNEKEKQIKADLEIKKKKLSHAILRKTKDSLTDSIKEDEERLSSFSAVRKQADIAEKRRDFFRNLTPDQRKLISEYYVISEQVKKLANLVREHSSKRESTRRNLDDREIILRAFEILCQKENMTQEDIAKIFDQLDKVAIKRHRGEYDMKSWSTSKDAKAETYAPAVKGFVKHIYEADPNFVERNAWEISDEEPDEQEY